MQNYVAFYVSSSFLRFWVKTLSHLFQPVVHVTGLQRFPNLVSVGILDIHVLVASILPDMKITCPSSE